MAVDEFGSSAVEPDRNVLDAFIVFWVGPVGHTRDMRQLISAAGALLGCVVLVACGSDDGTADGARTPSSSDPMVVDSQSPSAEPTEECATVIPDDALAAFGWPSDRAAVSTVRGCERRAGHNYITVGADARVVAGAGKADRAAQLLDRSCSKLARHGAPVDRAPDWLRPDVAACYQGLLPGKDTGTVTAYLRTENDAVVHVRLTTGHPVATEQQIRDGLTAIAQGADTAF